MAVFAIADLHLPAQQKPMDVFGEHWRDHFQRIREDWLARVAPGDLVLLPGGRGIRETSPGPCGWRTPWRT